MAMLIRNGTLVDGTHRDPIPCGAVLVEGNRIVAVGREATLRPPGDAQVIDAAGGTIIPGLFNLHDHICRKSIRLPQPGLSTREQGGRLMSESLEYLVLHSAHNVLAELRSGVTTIVDYGLAGLSGIALKRAIQEGLLPGPRLLPCGNPICISGGHLWRWGREADGPVEVRKAVREQVKAGADCIKFMGSGGLSAFPDEDPVIVEYTLEELRAGAEEAHKLHKRAAVHAYANEAIKNAVRAGIDSIEHGAYLDEEAVAMMKQAGTALVPTISGLMHPCFRYRLIGRNDLHEAIMARVMVPQKESVRMAVEAGLRVGTGSDTGGEIVEEMELLQESAGMSNLDCLRAATSVAAEIAGIGGVTGTLEPGKCADLVVVDGQPLERLSDLRRPRWVLRDGQLIEGAPMPLSVRVRLLTADAAGG